jgi:hypothetical protein
MGQAKRQVPEALDPEVAFGDECSRTSHGIGAPKTDRIGRHTMEYAARLPPRAPGVTFRQFVIRDTIGKIMREHSAILPLDHSFWTGRFVSAMDTLRGSVDHLLELDAFISRMVRDDSWSSLLTTTTEDREGTEGLEDDDGI